MDSTGDDPLSPNSLFGSTWTKKKSRYDVDDGLSISPPDDDSSFFSLRFGAHHKPNESMYDRINKELGLSVETSKGSLTPELNIASASKGINDGKHTELFLGSSGLLLHTSVKPNSSTSLSVISGSANESPRIVIPSAILEEGEEIFELSLGEEHEKPEHSFVAQQDVETLVRKVRGGRPTRKISMNLVDTIDRKFLESVQDLKIENPLTQEQPKPHCPLLPTGADIPALAPSLIDSIPVVSAIRDRRRKVSAPPSLNPMKASNFFFTGGLFTTVSATTASTMGSSESPMSIAQQTAGLITQTSPSHLAEPVSPLKQIGTENSVSANFSLAQTTVLMEEGATQAAAFEPRSDRMGKRRPKATALREMNFWAPQSM